MADMISCIVADDDSMSLKIIENFISKTDGLECLAYCNNAIEASNALAKDSVDVLFLDVEMPEMTGLELIESLTVKPKIILISSKEKYAVPAFNLDVSDYLVKPIDYPRFLKAFRKVSEVIKEEKEPKANNSKIFVKSDSVLLGLEIDKISMVEAMADYVRIYVGDKRHTVYSSMKGLASKLPSTKFMRVHRSYIVNVSQIDSMEDNTLVVAGHLVPVGVTYQKALTGRLNLL